MYESPVNLIFQDIERQIVQQQEQIILEAIRKCGVVVDKDELIKAINYDRNQYSKGYKDGVNDVLDEIRAEIEDLDRFYDNYYFSGNNDAMFKCSEVLKILDKYRKEEEI